MVAERLRLAFQAAGIVIDGHEIGATVSIGVATSYAAAPDLDALIRAPIPRSIAAKDGGRNRYQSPMPIRPMNGPAWLRSRAIAEAVQRRRVMRKLAARRVRRGQSGGSLRGRNGLVYPLAR